MNIIFEIKTNCSIFTIYHLKEIMYKKITYILHYVKQSLTFKPVILLISDQCINAIMTDNIHICIAQHSRRQRILYWFYIYLKLLTELSYYL